MVGGRLIEIRPMRITDGDRPGWSKDVVRLWCFNPPGDECCVYAEPFDLKDGPQLGDEVWWQSGKIYFDNDRRHLTKVGYSFSAPSEIL